MTLQEKINLIEEIMDLDEGVLTPSDVLADWEEWDSLSTLALTVEMNQRFQIKLTTDKIKSFQTVQDICDIIPD